MAYPSPIHINDNVSFINLLRLIPRYNGRNLRSGRQVIPSCILTLVASLQKDISVLTIYMRCYSTERSNIYIVLMHLILQLSQDPLVYPVGHNSSPIIYLMLYIMYIQLSKLGRTSNI